MKKIASSNFYIGFNYLLLFLKFLSVCTFPLYKRTFMDGDFINFMGVSHSVIFLFFGDYYFKQTLLLKSGVYGFKFGSLWKLGLFLFGVSYFFDLISGSFLSGDFYASRLISLALSVSYRKFFALSLMMGSFRISLTVGRLDGLV